MTRERRFGLRPVDSVWFRELPAHWGCEPIKYCARQVTTPAINKTRPIALENVEGWTGRLIETNAAFEGDGITFQSGDLLFGKLRPYLAKVYRADAPGEAVGDFFVLRPEPGLDSHFAQYVLLAKDFITAVNASTYGAKMPRVGWDFMREMLVPLPPNREQQDTVAYLDRETARIDSLIEKKTRFIELLDEKLRALLFAAFGGWATKRIKYLSSFVTSGPRGWSEMLRDDGAAAFLQSGDLNHDLGIEISGASRVNPPDGAEVERTRLRRGDIVVCITGANTGRVAVAGALPNATFINQHLCLIRPRPELVLSKYLALVLHSPIGRSYFDARQYGLKEGLSLGDVSDAPVPAPPVSIQTTILESLEEQAGRIAVLSDASRRSIELLRERRSALITAAVIGQIDVREVTSSVAEAA